MMFADLNEQVVIILDAKSAVTGQFRSTRTGSKHLIWLRKIRIKADEAFVYRYIMNTKPCHGQETVKL